MDPDPIPFFNDFKDLKQKQKIHIFSYNLSTGTSSSVLNYFFVKILCKNLFCQALFQYAQHIYGKREGSGARSGSVPLTNGSGSRRPKNMRIRIPHNA